MNVAPQTGAILIVTATKIEAQAVLRTFSPNPPVKRQIIADKVYYDLGPHGGAPVFMVQSEIGIAVPGGALLTINQAIQDLRPQAIIMCGIAYGLRKNEQELGDILVSKQLHYYDPQDFDRELGKTQLGDRVTASERLLGRFRDAELEWNGAPLHFGLILSGERRVNDPKFRYELLKTEYMAIGGDMGGAGLYSAANANGVDWILVKAICNWADGEKTDSAPRSLFAAGNAAQFVLYVLEMGGWGKNLPDLSTSESLPVISETESNDIALDRQQFKSLEAALLSAFPTKNALERMIYYQQGKNLEIIVGDGSLQTIVFKLIQMAQSEGWLPALIRGAQVENPGNPELADFCQKIGLT
jgi:nucleoside phosphorylase